MDQARIAGLGNLLVDEALWRAGDRPGASARRRRRRRAHERCTGRSAPRCGCSAGAAGRHTGDMPRGLDAPCPRDGAPLQRRTVGGRTTYSCPAHQH